MGVRTHRHPERIPIAPSTQRPAVILPRLQLGIEDCAKTCTVKSKSRSASSRPEAYQLANDRSWRIVLKKSFLGDARNFLEPLMRFARGDVRDLIVSHKIDQGPSYRRHEALQR